MRTHLLVAGLTPAVLLLLAGTVGAQNNPTDGQTVTNCLPQFATPADALNLNGVHVAAPSTCTAGVNYRISLNRVNQPCGPNGCLTTDDTTTPWWPGLDDQTPLHSVDKPATGQVDVAFPDPCTLLHNGNVAQIDIDVVAPAGEVTNVTHRYVVVEGCALAPAGTSTPASSPVMETTTTAAPQTATPTTAAEAAPVKVEAAVQEQPDQAMLVSTGPQSLPNTGARDTRPLIWTGAIALVSGLALVHRSRRSAN